MVLRAIEADRCSYRWVAPHVRDCFVDKVFAEGAMGYPAKDVGGAIGGWEKADESDLVLAGVRLEERHVHVQLCPKTGL